MMGLNNKFKIIRFGRHYVSFLSFMSLYRFFLWRWDQVSICKKSNMEFNIILQIFNYKQEPMILAYTAGGIAEYSQQIAK